MRLFSKRKIYKRTRIINYNINFVFGMELENIIMSQHAVEKQAMQIYVDFGACYNRLNVHEPVTPRESKFPAQSRYRQSVKYLHRFHILNCTIRLQLGYYGITDLFQKSDFIIRKNIQDIFVELCNRSICDKLIT